MNITTVKPNKTATKVSTNNTPDNFSLPSELELKKMLSYHDEELLTQEIIDHLKDLRQLRNPEHTVKLLFEDCFKYGLYGGLKMYKAGENGNENINIDQTWTVKGKENVVQIIDLLKAAIVDSKLDDLNPYEYKGHFIEEVYSFLAMKSRELMLHNTFMVSIAYSPIVSKYSYFSSNNTYAVDLTFLFAWSYKLIHLLNIAETERDKRYIKIFVTFLNKVFPHLNILVPEFSNNIRVVVVLNGSKKINAKIELDHYIEISEAESIRFVLENGEIKYADLSEIKSISFRQ